MGRNKEAMREGGERGQLGNSRHMVTDSGKSHLYTPNLVTVILIKIE